MQIESNHKLVYLQLHILLVVRHSMYYFDVGYIVTEFGFNQSFFGVLLIPVTLSFGLFFFWRHTLNTNFIQICRFIIIMLLPVLLSLIIYGDLDAVFYSDDNLSPKSPFLILLPIALSYIFVISFPRWFLFFIVLITFIFHEYFIFYHICCFLTFYIFKDYIFSFLKKYSVVSILIYFIIFICVIQFKINKVNVLLNLLYSVAFCHNLILITKFVNKYLKNKIHSFVLSFNTLYFYLSQGLLFTLFSFYNFNTLLSIVCVFCVSHTLSFYLIKFEKMFLMKLSND